MSEIITAYPTSGLTDRTFVNINTALYDYFNSIKEVTDFFTIEKAENTGDAYKTGILFRKGGSFISIAPYNTSNFPLYFANNIFGTSSNGNRSNDTLPTLNNDISVRYVTGINGTTVVWLDDYSKGVCMVFGKLEDKYFIANSSSDNRYLFYYSDTGNSVNTLKAPFNGDNIGRGGDYILQPYYHYGINTKDLYTYDGGSGDIPFGKFKLGDAEFIRIHGNFALRLK